MIEAPATRSRVTSGRHLGPAVIAALPLVHLCVWIMFPPAGDGGGGAPARQVAGELTGAGAFILFACTLLLATRLRRLEPWFGGLDKMYVAHRVTALAASVLLVLHALVIRGDPNDVPPGRAPGFIAFTALLVLVVSAVAPRLPVIDRVALSYRAWRRTHKLTGLFFVMAFAHLMLVDTLVATTGPAFVMLVLAGAVGTVSYVYLLLFARFARRTARYTVDEVRRLDDMTAEVRLRPVRAGLAFTAGQFVFVRFKGDRTLAEPHPFTVSSAPSEPVLRLVIRAAGDFSRHLVAHLAPDTRAVVEGSYGQLDYKRGGPRQIWVAGGIGVTPFLSWIRDLDDALDRQIDVFYTVRRPREALFLGEMRAAARRHDGLRLHVVYSSDERLTVQGIAETITGPLSDRHVYMCGPARMISAFRRDLRGRGVPAAAIHVEEFNFR